MSRFHARPLRRTSLPPVSRLLLRFLRTALTVAAALTVTPAVAGPAEISPIAAQAGASAGELVLIDVRTPEEWRETGLARGAIPIAMQHPDGADGFVGAVLAQVGGDRNAPIALICRSGNRSLKMQRLLEAHGFTNVRSVAEGMSGNWTTPGWISRGLPVVPCEKC